MSCASCSFPRNYPITTVVVTAGVFLTASFLAHLVFKAATNVTVGIGVGGFASALFVALLIYRMKPSAHELMRDIEEGNIHAAIAHVTPATVRCEDPNTSSVLDKAIEKYQKAASVDKLQWLDLIRTIDLADTRLKMRPRDRAHPPLFLAFFKPDLALAEIFGVKGAVQLYDAIETSKPEIAVHYVTADNLKFWPGFGYIPNALDAVICKLGSAQLTFVPLPTGNYGPDIISRNLWLTLIKKIHETDCTLVDAVGRGLGESVFRVRDHINSSNDLELQAIFQ